MLHGEDRRRNEDRNLLGIHNRFEGGTQSDLIFTVIVETPKGLNAKQRELMRQFAEACGESNYGKKQRFFRKNKKSEG